MEQILKGRRVIITGGASGMGAGMVRAFPALGARVVSMDKQAEQGRAISTEAGAAAFVVVDVTDEGSVKAAVQSAVETLGGLDVLVHAAGVSPAAKAEETSLSLWNDTIAVNATGTFLTNRAVFPHLRDRGGAILNFTSAAGVDGYPNKAAYAAAKGAVAAWIRSVAQEWGGYGITVNGVAPAIWTPMYDKTRSEMTPQQLAAHDEGVRRRIVLGGRLGDVDKDFIPIIAFLASEGAHFLTGQIIPIDGGRLMMR